MSSLLSSYGRLEDIQKLEELGVSLEGKIAISRYGKIFRGNRLKNCQAAGAVGVIMYTDPAQVRDIQHSHWSSSYITALSLVESFRVLKYFDMVGWLLCTETETIKILSVHGSHLSQAWFFIA